MQSLKSQLENTIDVINEVMKYQELAHRRDAPGARWGQSACCALPMSLRDCQDGLAEQLAKNSALCGYI